MAVIPVLLILIIGITEMATDLYIPSLPSLQHYFETSESLVQDTISLNLLGLALAGPIYGALSDASGRRWVMLTGTAIFCIGSCGAAVAATIKGLIIWRFIQGFGAGVAYVIGLAIIKDIYKGATFTRIVSQIGIVTAVTPGIAPMIGAYILDWFGWQANFLIIAALACLAFMFLFLFLPETLPAVRRSHFSWQQTTHNYQRALTNPFFLSYAFMSAATLAGLWALFAATPFILIEDQKLSVIDFSYYSATGVLAYTAGALVNHLLLPRVGLKKLLAAGLILTLVGSLFLLYIGLQNLCIVSGIYLGTIIVDFGSALVFSTAISEALEAFAHNSGVAAATMSAIEIGLSSLVVFLMGLMEGHTIVPAASLMTVCALTATWVYLWVAIQPPRATS